MRRANDLARNGLLALCAATVLAACTTGSPDLSPAITQTQGPVGVEEHGRAQAAAPRITAPSLVTRADPPPPAQVSYPRYGDSDDYLCNFAPPGDPRTPAACMRLRGPYALPQPPARYGDSDDFVCNHGAPGDSRTTEACLRLRPPEH